MVSVIDSHCHIYPESIARRAVDGIGTFYEIAMSQDGTAQSLLRRMDDAGVAHAVVSSCATRPAQVSPINRFIAQTVAQSGGRLTGLGTMHPESADMQADFDEILSLGLHGVKMHHDFQGFAVDDPMCMPIYELCSERIPLLLHTGDKRYDYTNPEHVTPVLNAFPHLTMVGAHLGGWSVWEDAVDTLGRFDNFYVDCSSSLYAMTPQAARRVIRKYGAGRVMFGSDYPMWHPKKELERLQKLGLDEELMQSVLHDTAASVFSIDMEAEVLNKKAGNV